jgi:hypothetical protein
MDHGAISRFLVQHFDVDVDRAALPGEALGKLRETDYALVLVNRKLDADYSDGMDIIRAVKKDESLCAVPAMLVSNYADAQQAAVSEGAENGFGKAELGSADVIERLGRFLK